MYKQADAYGTKSYFLEEVNCQKTQNRDLTHKLEFQEEKCAVLEKLLALKGLASDVNDIICDLCNQKMMETAGGRVPDLPSMHLDDAGLALGHYYFLREKIEYRPDCKYCVDRANGTQKYSTDLGPHKIAHIKLDQVLSAEATAMPTAVRSIADDMREGYSVSTAIVKTPRDKSQEALNIQDDLAEPSISDSHASSLNVDQYMPPDVVLAHNDED